MSIAARRSHRGDEYQLDIAVHWLIRLLLEDDLDWVQIDSVVLPGDVDVVLVDDIVVYFKNGTFKYCQAKVHQPDRRDWSIADLKTELLKARDQLERDPSGKAIFYSKTPFGDLEKLIDDTPAFDNYTAFNNHAPNTLQSALKNFAQAIERKEEDTFSLCQRIEFGPYHKDWDRVNQDNLNHIVHKSDLAITILEGLARDNQAGVGKNVLKRVDIETLLLKSGIVRAPCVAEGEIISQFTSASSIGRGDLSSEIAGEKLKRFEIELITQYLEAGKKSILLTDSPGSGKSWILLELADLLARNNRWGVLFIKGDRFDDITTEADLQSRLGLSADIVALAARLTAYRQVIVIIDSLDALSLGRDQKALKVFLSLLDRLLAINDISVIAACRDFDLSHDPLLRDRKWANKVTIKGLDFENTVTPILKKWGIKPADVSEKQRKFFEIPRNLKIFERLVGKVPLTSLVSEYHFLDTFIKEVVEKDANLGEVAVLALREMAATLMKKRSLFIHKDLFKADISILNRLRSAEVLQLADLRNQIGFSHQTLLDTLITRDAFAKDKTLEDFILTHPPLPFIRPSVRSFFFNLRLYDPALFIKQVKKILNNLEIAYHIKRLIVESIAEIQPTVDDLSLLNWLLDNHSELFLRFLWAIKEPSWFDLLADKLYGRLLWDPSCVSLKSHAVWKLREWMNDRPREVVTIWCSMKDFDAQIPSALETFKHWKTEGVRELLESMLPVKEEYLRDSIGKAISRYVEANDTGDDLLWKYITANLSDDKIDRFFFQAQDGGLQCNVHDFHRPAFLSERLCKSEYLLSVCLDSIEKWSEKCSCLPESLFRNTFIYDSSWDLRHSNESLRPVSAIGELLKAVETAFQEHSINNSEWWQSKEPLIRQTTEEAIAYLLILAYRSNIECNVHNIAELLKREEIFKSGYLDDEVGELIRDAFPYLSENFQEELQLWILHSLYSELRSEEDNRWINNTIYNYLCRIPMILRLPEIQAFIEQSAIEFGLWPQSPKLFHWGGVVTSPISIEDMLALSDTTLWRLLNHYDHNMKDWYGRERLIGGTESIISTLRSACSRDPQRLITIVDRVFDEGLLAEYSVAIIEGITDHLSYRFGNLQPGDGWKPAEPLTDGLRLSVTILQLLNKYPALWEKGFSVASALRACCYILNEPDDTELLLMLFGRLSNNHDPEEVKQTNDAKSIAVHDLDFIALNSVRGILAEGSMVLATKLLEARKPIPEMLSLFLKRFSKDKNAGVRASIMRRLALLAHYDMNWGWDLFNLAFQEPDINLWKHGESFLYYQYNNHFDKVRTYLDRIKTEAPKTGGGTWSRISSLAYLSGYLTEEQLFDKLAELNNKEAWLGAEQVFSTNMLNSTHTDTCERGILKLLNHCPYDKDVLGRIDHVFEKLSSNSGTAFEIAKAYINAAPEDEAFRFRHFFYDWIAHLSENAPWKALTVCEKLLDRLDSSRIQYISYGEVLVSAAFRILREADDSDNPELISRSIALQDRLLRLNIGNISEALDKVGRA